MTQQPALIPLAGPANRQGRIAADVIMGKEPARFRGTQVRHRCAVFSHFGLVAFAIVAKSPPALLHQQALFFTCSSCNLWTWLR